MAGEINFGLVDPSGPAKIFQSYRQGELDQNALALQQQQIQHAQTANELSKYQLSSAKRTDEQQNALNEMVKQGFDPANPEHVNKLYSFGPAGQALAKTIAEQRKSELDITKGKGEIRDKNQKFRQDSLRNIARNPSDENVIAWGQDAVIEGAMTEDQMVAAVNQMLKMPPAERKAFAESQGITAGEISTAATAKAGQDITIRGQDITAATAKAGQEVTRRGQNITAGTAAERLKFDKDQATATDDVTFSPEAITNAAARYNVDGTLPPMGMGKQGATGRAKILNEAARLAGLTGDTAEEQRIRQVANKASATALTALTKQEAAVNAFEKTFNRNADMVTELATKRDQTGMPFAQKWIQAGKRATGNDPELLAYDSAIKGTLNEYTKIVSGSMGNTQAAVSEIERVTKLLNSAQTADQINAAIKMMKIETENRRIGFKEEKAVLTESMKAPKPGKVVQWKDLP